MCVLAGIDNQPFCTAHIGLLHAVARTHIHPAMPVLRLHIRTHTANYLTISVDDRQATQYPTETLYVHGKWNVVQPKYLETHSRQPLTVQLPL